MGNVIDTIQRTNLNDTCFKEARARDTTARQVAVEALVDSKGQKRISKSAHSANR